MLIDTHAHLTDENYADHLDEMIASFKNDGLEKVFTVGYDLDSSKKCVEIAEKYDNVYAIIGVHPDDSLSYTDEVEKELTNLAKSKKVIAIGEIGLDYHNSPKIKDTQKIVFVKQLELADKLGLPIVIHNRDSIGDCLSILKEHKDLLNHGGIVHCFSESYESYKEIKKLGLKIAFGGNLTFKNAVNGPKVATLCDIEDVVFETDCPYLTPVPHRGLFPNEPKYTMCVAEKFASLRGESVEEVIKKTTENVYKLFNIGE
ncbi:MAG: TatD family hydrolase [Clostridia bacterium]|nr:TatD family hydrolase [Clostridia bacterium]